MGKSIGSDIQNEIKRNYELIEHYKAIGPMGMFGAATIQQSLDMAHR